MSIDTPQKRSSVFELPGLMMSPYPSGAIGAADRTQSADFYAGIAVAAPLASNQTLWSNEVQTTASWRMEQNASSIWIPETEITQDSWEKEDKMAPVRI